MLKTIPYCNIEFAKIEKKTTMFNGKRYFMKSMYLKWCEALFESWQTGLISKKKNVRKMCECLQISSYIDFLLYGKQFWNAFSHESGICTFIKTIKMTFIRYRFLLNTFLIWSWWTSLFLENTFASYTINRQFDRQRNSIDFQHCVKRTNHFVVFGS